VYCTLCNRWICSKEYAHHLNQHAHCNYVCLLCGKFKFNREHLKRHLAHHSTVDDALLLTYIHLSDNWADQYVNFVDESESEIKEWCPACVDVSPMKFDIRNSNELTLVEMLNHICAHLGYCRFRCVLCTKDSTEQAVNFLTPKLITSHIETHHKYSYQILSLDRVILKRHMSVGLIERILRLIHKCDVW